MIDMLFIITYLISYRFAEKERLEAKWNLKSSLDLRLQTTRVSLYTADPRAKLKAASM